MSNLLGQSKEVRLINGFLSVLAITFATLLLSMAYAMATASHAVASTASDAQVGMSSTGAGGSLA